MGSFGIKDGRTDEQTGRILILIDYLCNIPIAVAAAPCKWSEQSTEWRYSTHFIDYIFMKKGLVMAAMNVQL